ncbi:MAG: FAD-dependent oxidoreductase [Nitrospirota bacterium]|nr:MAG: FAD-dependent oxidoreductase [Nitrospirota bacterium]
MSKQIVFVGGGHAHLMALLNCNELIDHGYNVTLVSTSSHHYYSGMGPGMLSGIYRPNEIRFNVSKLVKDRGGDFIEGVVGKISPKDRVLILESGDTVKYDVVSFNTGSGIPTGTIEPDNESTFTVKPIFNLLRARKKIIALCEEKNPKVVVVGGGAAGIEVAGNTWRLLHAIRGEADVTLIAGKRLMGRFIDRVRYKALSSFSKRGIRVIEGSHAERVANRTVDLSSGAKLDYDIAFLATGVEPSHIFRASGLSTGDDGGLLVNDHLQSVDHPDIFGGGDCISFQRRPLDKVGVYATRQNEVLFNNIKNAAAGKMLIPFDPGGSYLLICNLGDGTGLFWRDNIVFNGKIAFIVKDIIDRRFMRKFQVSGELFEQLPYDD